MDGIPFSVQFAALAVLLGCSAFFSVAETAMMASNRHRLRHLARQGDRGALLALDLLGRTDKMLGVILLGNNLTNAAAATLVSVITIELFGEEKWALSVGTLLVTFAMNESMSPASVGPLVNLSSTRYVVPSIVTDPSI